MMSHNRKPPHQSLTLLLGGGLWLFMCCWSWRSTLAFVPEQPTFVHGRRRRRHGSYHSLQHQAAVYNTAAIASSSWQAYSRNGTAVEFLSPYQQDVAPRHKQSGLERSTRNSKRHYQQQQQQQQRQHLHTSRSNSKNNKSKFRLYCDLDGVLVDFEAGIRRVFPHIDQVGSFHIANLDRQTMWDTLQRQEPFFFGHLPWTPQGQQLWQSIAHLEPSILTGVPPYRQARLDKVNWCQRELLKTTTTTTTRTGDVSISSGSSSSSSSSYNHHRRVHHVDMAGHWDSHVPVNGNAPQQGVLNVITCWSNNKHHESHPNAILIDDREFLRHDWERKGGIFVHYTGNASETIQRLRDILGVPLEEEKEQAVQEKDVCDQDPLLP